MTSRLTHALATTTALAAVFSDESVLKGMLDVEVALARVQARLGVIPAAAGDAIAAAASPQAFDVAALVEQARGQAGNLAAPFVAAFTARVRSRDPEAAKFVHWGATSQDIVDTALVGLIVRAGDPLAADHARLAASLRSLADRHAHDLMLGRTLLQPAPPITFGLKTAGWLGGVSRSWARVEQACREAAVLQFGGASGTLAALGAQGPSIAEALAAELHLPLPLAPWHAHRDRVAAVVAACGIYVGMLGKMARDVSLLMQGEVAEAAEPGGGSSTMPQKRNPVRCAVALAAAARMPGLVASALTILVQEHERAVGHWQAEWPIVSDAVQSTGAALEAMREVAAGLTVDPMRMRANLAATRGAVLAERVMMRVGAALGRDVAHVLLHDALSRARSTGQSLGEVLRGLPEIARLLSEAELRTIDDPEQYLGAADEFRRALEEEEE